MKKINKTKKKPKKKSSKINPVGVTYEKELNRLVDKDVILYIFKNAMWKKYYGILTKPKVLPKIYAFQFNPLNQWKYEKPKQTKEKVQPIKRTNKEPEFMDWQNDFNHEMLIQSEFENDQPTYNYFFNFNNVVEIEENSIYLQEPDGKFSEIP